jgi:hypothetical protein
MIAFIDAHREVYGVEPICRVPPRRRGPWRRAGAVEFAALEQAGWFNNRRLLTAVRIRLIPAHLDSSVVIGRSGGRVD